MQQSNVIDFPKRSIRENVNKEPTKQEIDESLDTMKLYHIQEIISDLMPTIFIRLEAAGFDFDDEETYNVKDGMLLIEALRSLLCKQKDIPHPLQEIAETLFEQDVNDPEAYKIVDKISLDLTPYNNERGDKI